MVLTGKKLEVSMTELSWIVPLCGRWLTPGSEGILVPGLPASWANKHSKTASLPGHSLCGVQNKLSLSVYCPLRKDRTPLRDLQLGQVISNGLAGLEKEKREREKKKRKKEEKNGMKGRKKTPCDVIELSNSYINNSLAIFFSYFILFLFFTPSSFFRQ